MPKYVFTVKFTAEKDIEIDATDMVRAAGIIPTKAHAAAKQLAINTGMQVRVRDIEVKGDYNG